MILLALSVAVFLVTDDSPSDHKKLASFERPLPAFLTTVVDGIENVLGAPPQLTVKIADTAAVGEKPTFEASVSLTDGIFSLPTESMPFELPSEVQTILDYIEGVTKSKLTIGFDATVVPLSS